MQRWLQRNRNEYGEWSLRDTQLGYRICRFNGHAHEVVHVHHEDSGLLEPLAVDLDEEEALNVVYRYHAMTDRFECETLTELVNGWRSQ